jgi:plastocyanin
MRIARTLPLTAALVLTLAAPASGAPVGALAFDFGYSPLAVAVGDRVTWTFSGEPHTVTAYRRQTDYFDSGQKNAGTTYARTFNRPGRFSYFCEIHPDTMKGTIRVGTPETVDPRITDVSRRRSRHRIRMFFTLDERAVVAMTVARGDAKKVKRGRFAAGDHSIYIGALRRDTRYRVKLVAKDGWRNLSDPVRRIVRTLD